MFGRDLASRARTTWQVTGPRAAVLEVDLGDPGRIGVARLEENITRGQRVSAYRLVADGTVISRGTTVGCAKIDQFSVVEVRKVRLEIETVDVPERVAVKLY